MKNAEELNQWLGTLGLTPEQAKIVAPVMTAVMPKLGESVMMRSDYSKAMDTAKSAEAAAKKALDDTTRHYQSLNTWREGSEQTYKKQKEAEAAAIRRLEAARSHVSKLKADYGIEDDDLKPIFDDAAPAAAAAAAHAAPPVNDSYLTKDAYKKDLKEFQGTFPLVAGVLFDLNTEHMRLYGTPMSNSADLVAESLNAGRDLKEFAEEKFKFADKRTEQNEAAINARIEAARKEEREKLRSEQLNPAAPGPQSGTVSPVLNAEIPRVDPTAKKDPRRGVLDAVRSYGTHGGQMPGGQAATAAK